VGLSKAFNETYVHKVTVKLLAHPPFPLLSVLPFSAVWVLFLFWFGFLFLGGGWVFVLVKQREEVRADLTIFPSGFPVAVILLFSCGRRSLATPPPTPFSAS